MAFSAALSTFAADAGFEVVRDARFSGLGLLGTDQPEPLVALYSATGVTRLKENPNIKAVLTSSELAPHAPQQLGMAVSSDPLAAFLRLHVLLHEGGYYWTDFDSEIAPAARIHPRAHVASRSVRIADDVTIGPLAVIHERTEIASGSTIGAGTVIGAEGFEVRTLDGVPTVMPHAGGVRIGRRVDIQSNAVVDRSLYGGFTDIGDDTKINHLVHIAHGARVGQRCRIAASAVIAGSATILDDVWIGPNATVSNSVRVGTGAFVTLGAVVVRDVPDGKRVSGNFARDHHAFLRFVSSIR